MYKDMKNVKIIHLTFCKSFQTFMEIFKNGTLTVIKTVTQLLSTTCTFFLDQPFIPHLLQFSIFFGGDVLPFHAFRLSL